MRAKRYLGGVSRSAHRLERSLEESLSSGDVSLESGDIEDDSMTEAEARQKLVIKRIHLLSACSLLSAEFGAVLEGFLFSTYAGVYKSMLFWPRPLIKSLC